MQSNDDVLMRTAEVKKRYGGVSSMWIERRIANDPSFPKPLYIARRRFWRLGDLVAWERMKAQEAAAVDTILTIGKKHKFKKSETVESMLKRAAAKGDEDAKNLLAETVPLSH